MSAADAEAGDGGGEQDDAAGGKHAPTFWGSWERE